MKERRKGRGEGGGGLARKAAGLPLKGLWLALKGLFGPLFRRYPWLKPVVILLPILVVLALLGPVVDLLVVLLQGLGALLRPLLETALGRFIAVNLLLLLLALLGYILLRGRIYRFIGNYVLARHMEGISQLLQERDKAAAASFRGVVRFSSWLDLSRAVPQLPRIKTDASLRLAAIELDRGRVNAALRVLLRIRKGEVAAQARSSYCELLARAYYEHPSLGRPAVRTRLEELAALDKGNLVVLQALRLTLEADGLWEETARLQKRIVALLPEEKREDGRKELGLFLLRAARRARSREQGDQAGNLAREALKAWPGLDQAQIFLGDLEMEQGAPAKALRRWARAPGLVALDRLDLLVGEGLIGEEGGRGFTPRNLARAFPYAGILVVLARHWVAAGELRKAANALEKLLEMGDRSPRVLALHGAIQKRMGRDTQAEESCRLALSSVLGLPVQEPAAGEPPTEEKGEKP